MIKKILILVGITFSILFMCLFDFSNDILEKIDIFVTGNDALTFENSKMYVSTQNELIYEFVLTNNTSDNFNYKLCVETPHEGAFDFVKLELSKNGIIKYNDKLSKMTSDNIFEIDNIGPYEAIEYKMILTGSRIKFKLTGIIKPISKFIDDIPSKITVTMPNDPKTERNFTWHMNSDNPGYIQIVKAKNDNLSITNFEGKNVIEYQSEIEQDVFNDYVHTAKATNLQPGTKYYYRVGDKINNIWSNVGSFITDDGDKSFSFLYLTDMQTNSNEYKNAIYTAASAINRNKNAEFLLNTGDFVNTPSYFEEWEGIIKSDVFGNITNVAAQGNHDYDGNYLGNSVFKQHFYFDIDKNINTENGLYYSFNYGNTHFVVLDTNDYAWSELSGEQITWLENDLKKSQDYDFRIIAMHRGAYTSGPHLYEYNDILPLTEQLTPIFAKYNVDLVLQGHDHTYGLTYPINENYEIVEFDTKKIKSNETKERVSVMHKPGAPVYYINGAAGNKHYNTLVLKDGLYEISNSYGDSSITLEHDYLGNIYNKFQKVDTPIEEYTKLATFSSIEIKGKTLIVNTYSVDNLNFGVPKLYHSFGIKK